MILILKILPKILKRISFKDARVISTSSLTYNDNKNITGSTTFDVENLLESDKEYDVFVSKYLGVSSVHNCFIIHPYVKWGPQKMKHTDPEKQIEEAEALIRTLAPWKILESIIIPLQSMHKKTLFGTGTLERLTKLIRTDPRITAVFINVGSLKYSQVVELEKEFGVTILDRYKIVMQILKLHAISAHAKLQVALAELPYIRSRLRKEDFSIIPSEDWETRKFMLQNREQKLKIAIKKLRSQRQLLRKRRQQMDFPIIAVVGYTNAGKTSLIKALSGDKRLQPRNQLFATLDVTMHAALLPSTLEVLYVDTVGFISNIPTTLIECFVVTLEDALLADLIIHIEDLSSNDIVYQRNHVLSTLENLAKKTESQDLMQKIITVGNKYDLVPGIEVQENTIAVSSKTMLGIDGLRHRIDEFVLTATERKIITIKIPSGGDEMRWLYKNATVISATGVKENMCFQNLKVIITNTNFDKFKHYFIKGQ